jgi:poly(3-hydroxybutyrate) depolymerase
MTMRFVVMRFAWVWMMAGTHLLCDAWAGPVTNTSDTGWGPPHLFECEHGSISWQLFSPVPAHDLRSLPLVIWLHGGSRSNGKPDLLTPAPLTHASAQEKHPCYLLVPCAIPGRNWVSEQGRRLAKATEMPDTPTASMRAVMALLERLLRERAIDAQRIAIGGASGGGFGVWAFLYAYPGRFTSAFPIAGGGDPSAVIDLSRTRVWIFHGQKDTVAPPDFAKAMFHAQIMRRHLVDARGETPGILHLGTPGGALRLTLYKDEAHVGVAERALAEPDFMAWLFPQDK